MWETVSCDVPYLIPVGLSGGVGCMGSAAGLVELPVAVPVAGPPPVPPVPAVPAPGAPVLAAARSSRSARARSARARCEGGQRHGQRTNERKILHDVLHCTLLADNLSLERLGNKKPLMRK